MRKSFFIVFSGIVLMLVLSGCFNLVSEVPNAPSNLRITSYTSDSISISWTSNSSNSSEFEISRSTNGNTFDVIATVSLTSYLDNGLSPNTTYYYRVRARADGNYSEYSNLAPQETKEAVPVAPSNLCVTTFSDNFISLSWTDNSSNENGFELWRSLNGSSFSKIETLSPNVTNCTDLSLSPNTTYYYKIKAYNDGGYSNYSNTVSKKTDTVEMVPAAPGNLKVVGYTSNSIILTWDDNSSNESGFRIYRSSTYSGNYSLISTSANNYFMNTNLNSNTTYYYKVTAYNSVGESGCSNVISGKTSAPSYAHAKILQTNSYIDSINWLHVVGVIQNDGTKNLKYVKVNATFYDKSNNVVDSDFTYAYMDILTPQEKSPFDVLVSDPANYDRCELSLSYSETTDVPFQGLKIQGVTHRLGNYGYYYIDGEVKNDGTSKAEYVEIVATLYDSNGKIIDADFTFTNSDINVGQTSSFEFMINTSNLPGSIASFELQVQAL